MAEIEKSIEVNVPLSTAYNAWSRFETFPSFMEGVQDVQRKDDRLLHWKVEVKGRVHEYDAEITEMIPNQTVAWRAVSGKDNGGVVTFDTIDLNMTRINLKILYEPEGAMESMGEALGFVDRRAEADLQRFKGFVESGARVGGGRMPR